MVKLFQLIHDKFIRKWISGLQKLKDYDLLREDILESLDYEILRFKNEKIINDIEGTILKLEKYL